MTGPTGERWPPATILLTGLSASGKTTLARALVASLADYGISNVVLLDGEEFRARLPRLYGHSPSERKKVWQAAVKEARKEMDAGNIVVIAAIAHQASMRNMARKRLAPFFEVHLDCSVEACAARDFKGQYERAFANEYDCFIGVTHPYEQTTPELRVDTANLAPAEAQAILVEHALHFLATSESQQKHDIGNEWLGHLFVKIVADKLPPSFLELPSVREGMLRLAQARSPVVRLKRPGCAQLMVVFSGADIPHGRGEELTGQEVNLVKSSGLFRRNLLWLQDPYLDNFARGISPEVPDMERLADWISSEIPTFPQVTEVHGVGYSSGSYGALAFGHLCRMQSVWAFSPRPVRPMGADEAMARLKEMLSRHNGVTQFHILHSAHNKRDSEWAQYLADCPGVTIHAFTEYGDSHALAAVLASRGLLAGILPPFVAAAKPMAETIPGA